MMCAFCDKCGFNKTSNFTVFVHKLSLQLSNMTMTQTIQITKSVKDIFLGRKKIQVVKTRKCHAWRRSLYSINEIIISNFVKKARNWDLFRSGKVPREFMRKFASMNSQLFHFHQTSEAAFL